MKYKKTKKVSFPIGGIGSGCISLAGNGELIDWEIFNRPNKNTRNGYSHFAVKAICKDKTFVKVLHGDTNEDCVIVDGKSIPFEQKGEQLFFSEKNVKLTLEIQFCQETAP